MAARTTQRDGGSLDEVVDGDWGRHGCGWDESVCSDEPEYRIVAPDSGDGGSAGIYCPRHYALELIRLVEIHLPECSEPLSAHVSVYQRIPR